MTTPPDPLSRCLAMVSTLNEEHQWGLDMEACRYVTDAVIIYIVEPCSEAMLRRIIFNYYQDHQQVTALGTDNHPQHNQTWEAASHYITKVLYTTIGNQVTVGFIEIEDLAQTASMEVRRSLANFRFKSRLLTWMHEVAVRSARRQIRDSKAKKRDGQPESIDDHDEITIPMSAMNQPEAIAAAQALIELIRELLAQHPDQRLRTIFLLWAVHDRSVEEIGHRIHLHPSRVRTLLALARTVLREHPHIREWNEEGY